MTSTQHHRNGHTQLLDRAELHRRIEQLLEIQAPRYRRLWMYYRNPMVPRALERDEQGSDRPYRQAQEWGLPSRVTGVRAGASPSQVDGVARKEVVIENDIAWRIDTATDFLFGRPIVIRSRAADSSRRAHIDWLLKQILDHNGGQPMLQHLATLGAVYGFVDLLVTLDPQQRRLAGAPDTVLPPLAGPATAAAHCDGRPHADPSSDSGESAPLSPGDHFARIARCVRMEIVEPARALPVLSETDWRQVDAYVTVWQVPRPSGACAASPRSTTCRFLARLGQRAGRLFRDGAADELLTITEILTADSWQRYHDEELVDSGVNSLGRLPLVHVQNLPVPFEYSGTSDVEPLIPLQDELNTRLSDRANRITMQSFKMYLGKGIDGFTELPVAPGRMWSTDNSSAEVIEFGGESACPSEDRHIDEIRESLDKISGVTPIAAGILRGRIGHLSSAAALRVTMMALLARTQRKRVTYGRAIEQACELSLAWLDRAGLFATAPSERDVQIEWADPLPDLQST